MYVYFIQEGKGNHGNIKIGKSNDVDKRLKSLQTGNPRKLTLMASIKCKSPDDAFKLESKFHLKFQDKQIRGEWFGGDIRLNEIQEDFEIEPDNYEKQEVSNFPRGVKLDKLVLKKYNKAKKLVWIQMGEDKPPHKEVVDFLWRTMRIESHSVSAMKKSVIYYCEANGLIEK